jgi:hypothetical protein
MFIVMRYYININKLSQTKHSIYEKKKNETDENWILTNEGFYKYTKNNLFKYKLDLTNEDTPEKYGDIMVRNISWKKHSEEWNIPLSHDIVKIKKVEYKLYNKSSTSFIIEYMENEINDYYFESVENIDNYSLKEDINSFLSMLK